MLGILKAIKTFDETKSSFKTWAWYWVRSYIRDEITKHKPSGYTEYEDSRSLDRHVLIAQFYDFVDGDKDKEVLTRYLSGQTTTDRIILALEKPARGMGRLTNGTQPVCGLQRNLYAKAI